jgi:hypothetical protein
MTQTARLKRFWDGLRARGVDGEYRVWHGIRDRCLRKNARDYPRYGGRGITIDPTWDDFEVFLKDVGRKPGHGRNWQLDRKENDGPYCKENCRWATPKMQSNNKRNTTFVVFEGVRQPLQPLIERFGWKRRQTVHERLKQGVPIYEALTRPSQRASLP